MIIQLLIDGGDMKPGPAIAQKIGPLGINMGKVISEVNAATKDFKGMKVPVELNINEKTKSFTVKTSSPPTSELLKKEMAIETGSADHKKVQVANASIEDIIKVSKIKFPDMLQKEFKSAVKSVLGTCASIGILVENEDANDLIQRVAKGEFEKEISSKSTETTSEKRKALNQFFSQLKKSQEELIKKEQAAAEEAQKSKEEAVAKVGAEKSKEEAVVKKGAEKSKEEPKKASGKEEKK